MKSEVAVKNKIKVSAEDRAVEIICYIIFSIAAFLCLYPFYYILINTVSANDISARGDVLFWPKGFHLHNYVSASRIDGLLQAGRPEKAIDLMGPLRYSGFPFDARRAVRALTLSSARNYKINIHDVAGQNYLNVLCLVQDSEDIGDDEKLSVEWRNVEYLAHAYRDECPFPKYIYKKMSLSPDYFCKVLSYAYDSRYKADRLGKVTLPDEHVTVEEQVILSLLWNWRLIPEFYSKDNRFYSPLFEQWFDAVVEIAGKTGRCKAALATIGEALVFTPAEADGSLWINKRIAKLIDKIEYEGLRDGYRCGCCDLRNSRSDADLKFIEQLNERAAELNKFGCPRFADSLLDIVKEIKTDWRQFRVIEEE